jgi:hypothetical protein
MMTDDQAPAALFRAALAHQQAGRFAPADALCDRILAAQRPTWLMLSTIADWRWLAGRTDSPWYPTMRLFRQDRPPAAPRAVYPTPDGASRRRSDARRLRRRPRQTRGIPSRF